MKHSLARRLAAEAFGTGFLVAAVVGSGIMAAKLAGGNGAVALLCNTIPTGAILFVMITIFLPISGAHLNPAVTAAMRLAGRIETFPALAYAAVQIAGGCLGTLAAHAMFDLDIVQFSATTRTGPAQWFSEFIATFGLVLTIFGAVRYKPDAIPAAVGLYITSAYWFTASTSFANPAVTIARAFSDTFSGIAPADVAPFVAAQITGGLVAAILSCWLFKSEV
jgi:glycerol uptake facilitator-like aquaporin